MSLTKQEYNAQYKAQYYSENKEKLQQYSRDYYAKKVGRPVGTKRGRKPGPVGSYKEKWRQDAVVEITKQIIHQEAQNQSNDTPTE
jgi:hypothetical protein